MAVIGVMSDEEAARRIATALSTGVASGSARHNKSVVGGDPQQKLLLEELRRAAERPVSFSELHAAGVSFPATVISELELDGYAIERVADHGRLVGVRLLAPERTDRPLPRPRRPWRRTST